MSSSNEDTQLKRVLKFYKECESSKDYYICTICENEKNINKPLCGKSKANLRKHLYNCHPKTFVDFCAPYKKYDLAKKRLQMIQSFAEIVTVNGRPFEYLCDSGFRRLTQKDLDELAAGGMPIHFSNHYQELKKYIAHLADEIQSEIKKDFQERFVCILMDIGTKNNKSMLGISGQCMIDDKVRLHSLGVMPLDSSHTASYLLIKLKECLQKYEIIYDDVISFTTDNGSNLIALTNKFEELMDNESTENNDCIEQEVPQPIVQIDDPIQPLNENEIKEILTAVANEEELDRILNEEDDYDQLFNEIASKFSQTTTLVNRVRCGAHTLQLMVLNALDKSDFRRILTLCRAATKFLRNQTSRYDLKGAGIADPLPVMYCTTRWDADLLMVRTFFVILGFTFLFLTQNNQHFSIYCR